MNLRAFSIPLTMVVAFSLTLGISLWRQRASEPHSAEPAGGQVPEQSEMRFALSAAAQAAPPIAQPLPSGPPPVAAVPAAGDGTEHPDLADVDIPVAFMFKQDATQPGPTATLLNISSESLSVSVTAANAANGHQSQVQVAIDAHRRKNLTDAGLLVESGDRVTLQSPPYHDQVIDLP